MNEWMNQRTNQWMDESFPPFKSDYNLIRLNGDLDIKSDIENLRFRHVGVGRKWRQPIWVNGGCALPLCFFFVCVLPFTSSLLSFIFFFSQFQVSDFFFVAVRQRPYWSAAPAQLHSVAGVVVFFFFIFYPPPSLPIFFSFILAISFINRWTIGQSMNKCMKLICRRGQRRHLVIGLAMSTTPLDDVCLSRSSVYLSTYVRVCLCVLVCVCECVCVSRSIDLQNNATWK